GAGKDDSDISAVRANFPFRPQCGLFYYEVEIVSKGVDGHIGIGFCWASTALDKLPGWEEHSWGYHGDDGHLFSGPGTSRAYGPKFGTGDMIGCGFDFRTNSAFYTKNGVYLGTAFKNIPVGRGVYPFVGFKTSGERIRANFGSHDFVFDIEQYFQDEQRQTANAVLSHPLSRPLKPGDVVLEYLLHNGYSQTAMTLLQYIRCGDVPDEKEMNATADAAHRSEIRRALLRGNVDRVIEICNEHYPGVLEENKPIQFRLSCRKFVEMVRELHRNGNDPMDVDDASCESIPTSTLNNDIKQHAGVKRRRSDIDGNGSSSSSSSSKKEKGEGEHNDTQDEVAEGNENERMIHIMAYGKKLQQSYSALVENDPELKAELMATFSSLAYTNIEESAVSYLFESSHGEKLASDINAAILVSQNRHPVASLERLYRQTTATIDDLVLGGNSQAAMLTPEKLLPNQ
ncbi:concanavalin A-like lectin/glucanase domain-containing protein, partial [Dichotomocladium elegans]